ncbi:hypothetical protein D6C90_06532 [Aureobasidium pullulans]|uniref:BTB domain-containing protein n=1 Tax=Aureobasidium pullulans TaxID=5580 RepID=A0A4S9UHR1_AURPU|nr:hypothetical protein D6C90_06532 [Aureobasidium pullulans]
MPDVEETLGTLTDVEEIPELIPVTEDTTEHASVVEVTPNIVPFARRTSKIVSVPSELPPLSCFGGTTIDLETSDGEVFTERKSLLCHYSGYFRGALAGGFSEATMDRLPIPSIDSDHFEIRSTLGRFGFAVGYARRALARYIIPALQNAAMNALQAKHEATNLHTLPGSALRKQLVDWVTCKMQFSDLLEPGFVDSLPREFLRDVVLTGHKQSLALQGTFYMPKRENCYYHVHTADEHC